MLSAKEAYNKTIEYTEKPFDFKKRNFEIFKSQYKNGLERIMYKIEEATKEKMFSVNYEVLFSNIYSYYDGRDFLKLLYKKNELNNLLNYLDVLGYKSSYQIQYLISSYIPVGLTFKISWGK